MCVRKSVAFVVALLLLVSQTGFALTVHYCGDRISSVSSGMESMDNVAPAAEKACCAAKVSHRKCCSDKTILVKAKKNDGLYKSQQEHFYPVIFSPPLTATDTVFAGYTPVVAATFYCDGHAPPLFLQYCQLIFYA